MNWHVLSTILLKSLFLSSSINISYPLSKRVTLGEVTQIVGSVENIGSQDVAGLLGIPDLGFSDPILFFLIYRRGKKSLLLVGNVGDFEESGDSPDNIVTSQVPSRGKSEQNAILFQFLQVPSIVGDIEGSLGSEEGKGSLEVVVELSEESVHDEDSGVEVTERNLSNWSDCCLF